MGLEGQVPARMMLYFIANLMLVALGLLLGVQRWPLPNAPARRCGGTCSR
jgi:hypothetical protein